MKFNQLVLCGLLASASTAWAAAGEPVERPSERSSFDAARERAEFDAARERADALARKAQEAAQVAERVHMERIALENKLLAATAAADTNKANRATKKASALPIPDESSLPDVVAFLTAHTDASRAQREAERSNAYAGWREVNLDGRTGSDVMHDHEEQRKIHDDAVERVTDRMKKRSDRVRNEAYAADVEDAPSKLENAALVAEDTALALGAADDDILSNSYRKSARDYRRHARDLRQREALRQGRDVDFVADFTRDMELEQ